MRFLTLFFALRLTVLAVAIPQALRKHLTFHASFDKSADADIAKGDAKIYHAPDFEKQFDQAAPGIGDLDVAVEDGALHFRSTNRKALFFRGARHIAAGGGTFSFWLRLDPARDLWPNYSDPLQLTNGDYNDRALWVDFSKDDRPRHFRLGAFGNLQGWNRNFPQPEKNPDFMKRLIILRNPPFTRDSWTHIAITWTNLGTPQGVASVYVNGKLVDKPASVPEAFDWSGDRLAIRLGLNYTGWMDDLAAFDRVLQTAEIASIYNSRK